MKQGKSKHRNDFDTDNDNLTTEKSIDAPENSIFSSINQDSKRINSADFSLDVRST